MACRLRLVLLAFALILVAAPISPHLTTYAQDGSPIAVDPGPTETPQPPEPAAQTEPDPATETATPPVPGGNTPAGFYSGNPIHARADVYFTVYQITVGGQTDVIDGISGGGIFAASGYRTDTAKVVTIETSAQHAGNFYLCIIFDENPFVIPSSVELLRLDGDSWTLITYVRDSTAICGYTPDFGVFAVAEPGATPPSMTPTDIPPTETATASPSATNLPSSTSTESPTPLPTLTETSTSSATSTETPTATHTASPSSTTTATHTFSPTTSATETETAFPSATSTSTATASPSQSASSTPPETPTHLPSATASAAATETPTSTATATASPTETETSTSTPTVTETSTSAPSPIQFALPNVYVTFAQIPSSGTTTGQVLPGSELPALPAAYLTNNAWFFSVDSTVAQLGNKRLCVNFETSPYADPHRLELLQRNGSNWTILPNQTLDSLLAEQGTRCGYISSFGEFALVERAPATVTPTSSSTRTPLPTSTASSTVTPSPTRTASATATSTPTPSASFTPSMTPTSTGTGSASPTATTTASATGSHTATPSPTFTPSGTATSSPTASATPSPTPSGTSTPTMTHTRTPTATLAPGSYLTGTQLRTTTRVNLRTAASTSSPSLGVISSGTTVAVTGPSVTSGGLIWVPVTSSLGSGWIAGNYLASNPTVTPTRTPAPPTSTQTPGGSAPTRTATRPPGGFIPGDAVRTTANVNLRSAPSTSATVIRVIPGKTEGVVTGPGVKSGGTTFYLVSVSGSAGYVAGSYLQRITATATPSRTRTPTATVVGTTVRYTTGNVNMRTGPGTGYRKVATIPKGTRINITGTPRRSGGIDWYPVILNGVGSGWMAGSFLTAIPPI